MDLVTNVSAVWYVVENVWECGKRHPNPAGQLVLWKVLLEHHHQTVTQQEVVRGSALVLAKVQVSESESEVSLA